MATLTPEELERQLPKLPLINAARPGVMAPQPAAPRLPGDPLPYGEQMGNIGSALLNGVGNIGRFITSAPGSTGPLSWLPSMANNPAVAAATTQAPVPPPSATAQASGNPTVPSSAAAPLAAPATAPAAPRPRTGGTARAAAPAAGTPALIPGETGFYIGDQLVPYGTTYNPGSGATTLPGGVPAAAGAAGGAAAGGVGPGGVPAGALIDPRQYFPDLVGQQMGYARNAAEEILQQAGSGSSLGYSARLRALASVYLNGLAGVGQGGANNFNSATAGIINQNTSSAAARYGSDNSLTGDLARSAATLGAAQIGATSAENIEAGRDERYFATPQPSGTQLVPGVGGIPTPVTTYAMPQRGGQQPKPVSAGGGGATPEKGAKTTRNGVTYTYNGRQWVAE